MARCFVMCENEKSGYEQFDHIPTEEIKKDISDTQAEIDEYQAVNEIKRLNPFQNKTDIYMNEGKISSRQTFINTLNNILEYRATI